MLFTDTETARLTALVQQSARAWSRAELAFVRDYAASQKPRDYDAHVDGIVRRYLGDGTSFLRSLASMRFPSRADLLQPLALNRMRAVAAADAGVYRVPPVVDIVDAAGVPVPAEDARAKAVSKMLDSARINSLRPEIERRAIAVGTLFVRPRWVPGLGGIAGRLQLDLFWPKDIACVCHPSDPANFDLATIILARASHGGVSTSAPWWTLWVRTYEDDDSGMPVSFSAWRVHHLSEDGTYTVPPDDPRTLYVDADGQPLPSPWTIVQLGYSPGSVYVEPDRDLPTLLDHLSLDASAEMLARDLQAFTPIVYAGSQVKKDTLSWGPAEVTRIGDGESLTTLSLDPKLQEMREGRAGLERELATARRNDPNAYVSEPGPPQSGVARLIQQAPHEAVLDENALVFQSWEQTQLLPACVVVHDAFSGNMPIGEVTFAVRMRRPEPFEEMESKQRRLQADVDAGLISPATMAVALGHYLDVAGAVKVGVSDELKKAAVFPSIGMVDEPFGAAVTEDVQKSALNGAQVASAQEIVSSVAKGELPRDAGIALLELAFQLSTAAATKVMGESGRAFKVVAPGGGLS